MSDCGCGCSGGGCQGNCGSVKIITEQGVKGDTGDTGATGAAGATGADGDDGLGYDNMTSTSSINLSLVLPFSGSADINIDKAVTVGTRLRYTKTSDLTQWIEGVVTSYTVGTGVCAVDFDNKSATAAGSHTDWSVSVIGEPGSGGGFDSIDNVGAGAEVYKGLNAGVAELRSLTGLGALEGGITQGTDEISFNPLTTDAEVEVYPGGTAIAPSFFYAPGIGESYPSPGSISANSKVKYVDWNDFIYLTFEVIIENFKVTHASNSWTADPVTFQINGLPVTSGFAPENYTADMFAYKVEDPGDQDFIMDTTKSIRLTNNAGNVAFKNDTYSTRLPITTQDINIVFYGHLLIRK